MHHNVTQTPLQRRKSAGKAEAEADVASAEIDTAAGKGPERRRPVMRRGRPLREVARLIAGENVNSMIVRAKNGGLGIVTDGNRDGCGRGNVGERASRQGGVGAVTTVGADAAGADVMLAMLRTTSATSASSPNGRVARSARRHRPGGRRGTHALALGARSGGRGRTGLGEAAQRLRSTVVALHTTELRPSRSAASSRSWPMR